MRMTETEFKFQPVALLAPPRKLTREECTTPEMRLEYIAQWLEAGGEARHGVDKFDMCWWHAESECGTTCCIGGAATAWFDGSPFESLGLSFRTAGQLFYPPYESDGVDFSYRDISPAWAARCIRKYQREGVVDWEGTR